MKQPIKAPLGPPHCRPILAPALLYSSDMMMNRLTACRRLPISFFLQCNACTVVSYNNVRQNVSMRIYIHTPINHGGLGAHLINLQGSKVLVDIVSIERRCLPTSPWPSRIESHAALRQWRS
jgi:hypothetical protein